MRGVLVEDAPRGVTSRPAPENDPRGEAMPVTDQRTVPLATISPIRSGWTPFARAVLQVLPQTPPGSSVDLQDLRFIQSARWSLITSLPGPDGPLRPKYDYLYFESNFNGSLDAYLENFAGLLGRRMRLIWNSAFGFPCLPQDESRSVPRRLLRPIPYRAFVDYVHGASMEVAHFYSAYPEATATEVLSGLHAESLLAELRGRALDDARDDGAPDRFAAALNAALAALQGQPPLARQPTDSLGDVAGDKCSFTALSPIRPDGVAPLRELLEAIDGGTSPFAAMPQVHFARWVIVDGVHSQPGQRRDGWPHPYLLTSLTCDGTRAPLEDLHTALGPLREQIWQHCHGHPSDAGPQEFASYLGAHRVPSNRFFTAYPYAGVGAVRAGLDSHQRLVEFARRHGRDEPARRLAAFRQDFCGR